MNGNPEAQPPAADSNELGPEWEEVGNEVLLTLVRNSLRQDILTNVTVARGYHELSRMAGSKNPTKQEENYQLGQKHLDATGAKVSALADILYRDLTYGTQMLPIDRTNEKIPVINLDLWIQQRQKETDQKAGQNPPA
ncbi:hypothetical protein HYU95_05775 [Candidatus Daviesbacteria bacterium]|nr:hypothetical protein [Candidatus Daviesbacteria bacterium]